tara:strand:+ start:19362 stop:20246 length:885 start_codon:yes stop_codon:yes gene_type:complete
MYLLQKLSSKIWTTYITDNPYDELDIEKIISEKRFIKIEPPRGYLMTADGSFIDENNILIECISIKTANGCIYIFNKKNKTINKISLNNNFHFSFPLHYIFEKRNYITLQSNIDDGLILYEYQKLFSRNNKTFLSKLKRIKVINNIEEKLLDPVLLTLKNKIFLFASSKKIPNITNCLGQITFENGKVFLNKNNIFCESINGRMAGKFIFKKNKIIANTQLFINSYGDGIQQYEIKKGNKPQKIKKIIFKQGSYYGPHTLNYSPKNVFILFDICRKSYSLFNIYFKLRQFLKMR